MRARRGIARRRTGSGRMSIADLRKDYGQASLSEADVAGDPIAQFTSWFEEALKAEVNGSRMR